MTTTTHDPGPDLAAAAFDGPADVAANPLELKGGGTVRIGTASWTAVSGTPTASASVEPYTLRVENIDDHTLRLTWVDRPGDNRLALFIDREAGRFVMVQPEHDTDGDAILHDRVLILAFRDAIDAGDIETFLQEGLDTPG